MRITGLVRRFHAKSVDKTAAAPDVGGWDIQSGDIEGRLGILFGPSSVAKWRRLSSGLRVVLIYSYGYRDTYREILEGTGWRPDEVDLLERCRAAVTRRDKQTTGSRCSLALTLLDGDWTRLARGLERDARHASSSPGLFHQFIDIV
jgi:hypothetical protein